MQVLSVFLYSVLLNKINAKRMVVLEKQFRYHHFKCDQKFRYIKSLMFNT
jgi:hypothetical protein